MFIIKLSISPCFGHHYAHHQENKTVSYCMRCSAWVCRLWLAVVLWGCVVSCVHCVRMWAGRCTTGCGRGQVFKCECGWDHCGVIGGCLLFLSLCSSGFQDLLILKPPSLLMLLGCICISMASLMRRSM